MGQHAGTITGIDMQSSSFIQFVRRIKGKELNHIKLRREFRKAVDTEDYDKDDFQQIMGWFEKKILAKRK